MSKLLFYQLNKDRFTFALHTTFKFICGGVLWIVLSDLALFVFQGSNHFPLFHFEVLKGIFFVVVMGIIFFMILQRHQGSAKEIDQQDYFRKNPHPMWIYDLESMRFLEVNDASVYAYGYSRKEFLSSTILDIWSEQERPEAKSFIARLQNAYRLPGLCEHVRKDGSILHTEVTAYSIIYKKQNASLIICTDITKQTKAEEELKSLQALHEKRLWEKTWELAVQNKELEVRNRDINSTNDELIDLNKLLVDANKNAMLRFSNMLQEKSDQLERLHNQISDIIWSIDLTGKAENRISKSVLKFFNISQEEIIDRPNFWMERIHSQDKAGVFEKLNLLEQNKSIQFSYRIVRGQNENIRVVQQVNLIYNEDGVATRMELMISESISVLQKTLNEVV